MPHIEQIPAHLTWKIRHQALYPNSEWGKAILENDEEGLHLGLFDENELRSVVSLFWEEHDLQFRKFATLPAFQNKGYGSALVNYLLDFALQEQNTRVWRNARRSASHFYRRFGFPETEITFYSNDEHFVVMEKFL